MRKIPRTFISEIKKEGNVLLKGWIHELRELSKVKFFLLRDSTGIVQCVVKNPSLFKDFSKLSLESIISLEGKVKKSKIKSEIVTKKDFEVEVEKIEIINKAEELPILVNEKKVSTAFSKRLDYRSIDLRKKRNFTIFKIQAAFLEGMQEWLNSNGFIQVFTPCLLGSASESGAEVFSVLYFDREAFLRQDPQLHRQLTIAGGIEKIYEIGPSWRAELSHTTRHLTEHRTCAVELAFIESEKDVMKVEEELIKAAIKKAREKCEEELKLFDFDIKLKSPFPELKFSSIPEILAEFGKKQSMNEDLDTEAEKLLANYVKEKYKADFFFINGFPFKIKPFYVYHDNEFARSVDLYCRNLELSSGGQREHRHTILMKNIKEKDLNPKNLEWFTKFFKYGVPPHGGFSIGIERLTQAILKLENIKEAVLFLSLIHI